MIIEVLVNLFFGLFDFLLDLIPDIKFDIGFSPLTSLVEYIGYVGNFLDMRAVSACLAIYFVISHIGFLVRLFNFIIRKIPGID